MTLVLGGPGVACSTMTLRRLAAGELGPEARTRAEGHLHGCARCQATARELEAERRALHAELPFDAFAAGVAERLAGQGTPARPAWRRALPMALAASLLLGVGLPTALRLSGGRGGLATDDGTRLKGAAAAALHVRDGAGSRLLAPGEPVPPGASLRLAFAPAGHRFAAAAVIDEDGPALLATGPANQAPGQAFEWTGRRGQLVVVFDDRPVDGPELLSRLARGGAATAAPGPAAEVVVLPLTRDVP
jgi:hypothetical protein